MLVQVQTGVQFLATLLVNGPQLFVSLGLESATGRARHHRVAKGEAAEARGVAEPQSNSPDICQFLLQVFAHFLVRCFVIRALLRSQGFRQIIFAFFLIRAEEAFVSRFREEQARDGVDPELES